MSSESKPSRRQEDRNPHNICVWHPKEECEDCSLEKEIHCRIHKSDTLMFLVGGLMFFVPAIAGMIRGGDMVGLIGYLAYWIVFLQLWENRVLCSHCPFYAEQGGKGHVLHCYANYGLYKLWPYDPRPMSSSHKVQFLVALGIFVGYPLPFLITRGQYFYLAITLIGIVAWLSILKLKICPKCLNFSCPFNSIPKDVVDHFLKLNPVMREAWEEYGYIID